MLVFPFVVTVDGNFLPDFPSHLLLNRDAKRTEVIMGTDYGWSEQDAIISYASYLSNSAVEYGWNHEVDAVLIVFH